MKLALRPVAAAVLSGVACREGGAAPPAVADLLDAMPAEASCITYLDLTRLRVPESPWHPFFQRMGELDSSPAPLDVLSRGLRDRRIAEVVAGSQYEFSPSIAFGNLDWRAIWVYDQPLEDPGSLVRAAVPAEALTVHEAGGMPVYEWVHTRLVTPFAPPVSETVFLAFPLAEVIVVTESLSGTMAIANALVPDGTDRAGPWSTLLDPSELDAQAILIRRCGAERGPDDEYAILTDKPNGTLVMTAPEAPLATITYRYKGSDAADMDNAIHNCLFHFTDVADVRAPNFVSGLRADTTDDGDTPDWAWMAMFDWFGVRLSY